MFKKRIDNLESDILNDKITQIERERLIYKIDRIRKKMIGTREMK